MEKAKHILISVVVTLLLIVFLLYGVLFVTYRGPSPTVRDRWARMFLESSAGKFVPKLFLDSSTIEELSKPPVIETVQTDASLIQIKEEAPVGEHYTDDWGYTDDDDDGIILVNVPGSGYRGYMMIVLDPSRVVLGIDPKTIGGVGQEVSEYVALYDAVAGINGGGFEDPNGKGNGGMPDSVVVSCGEKYCAAKGIGNGFVGLDENNVLHVGFTNMGQLDDLNIRDGCGYGPVLVANGKSSDLEELKKSGQNPRTAIGQRSDGAILMLVIEGRQPNCLGASYADEAEIMLRFGAVNAMNLDGGSSSMMWYNGGYVNNKTFVGLRDIPTSFLVLKEGV